MLFALLRDSCKDQLILQVDLLTTKSSPVATRGILQFKMRSGIQLEVYNRWGELIHEQNALDVNVLKDVGYNDYLFAWLGKAFKWELYL